MRRRAGIKRELASRVNQRVSRWFGHVKRAQIRRRWSMSYFFIIIVGRTSE